MASRKRRGSEQHDQPVAKMARLEKEESSSIQQASNDPSTFLKTFGQFELKVKLRSTTKAKRNDPELTLLQREAQKYGREEGTDDSLPFSPSKSSEGNVEESTTDLAAETSITDEGDEEPSEDKDEFSEASSDQEGYDDESDSFDSDCSENDPDFEFDWLEPIDIAITSKSTLDEHGQPKVIAYCEAKLIRRQEIRHNFHAEVEQPSEDTSMLAFGLFDRYGRLRPEFVSHPVIKGSGVWGHELDHGDMLIIERIIVNQAFRRQGLGKKMVEALLAFTRHKTWSFFAFVWPAMLRLDDIEQEWDDLKEDAARNKMNRREQDRAVAFYRSQGFRRIGSTIWFAKASDEDHPAHKLASADDFNPPEATLTTLHALLQPFEQINRPPISDWDRMLGAESPQEPDYLNVLKTCLQEKGSADGCWSSADKHGNTILHLAASVFNTACVEWILNQDFGAQLLLIRNQEGETPLELVQFKLEKLRTRKRMNAVTAATSDRFIAHDENAVRCLVLLKGLGAFESFKETHGLRAAQEIARGCTCGKCAEGFMSPRMFHALHTQAERGYDALNIDLSRQTGPAWVEENSRYLSYLSLRVVDNLKTNKSMRQGFANLWDHIATCLEKGCAPYQRNILAIVNSAGEWPPATKNFLQRGGTVESVFLAICRGAMEDAEWIGGQGNSEFFSEIAKLPECRNDLEFGFVSGHCGYRHISLVHNVNMMGKSLDEDGNPVDSAL